MTTVPTGNPTTVRVPKAGEIVADRIRRQIVTGQLHQGEALPAEATLVKEFGISRSTLREAFRVLESQGLVTVRRGVHGGARVEEPSTEVAARYAGLVLEHRKTTLDDVLAARVLVEAPAARMLAEHRDRARIADRLQEFLDTKEIDRAGFHEFNALVVELTDNKTLVLLTAMLENITQAVALALPAQHDEDALIRRTRRDRQALIDRVRIGDADGAEQLWHRHLTEAGRVLAAR